MRFYEPPGRDAIGHREYVFGFCRLIIVLSVVGSSQNPIERLYLCEDLRR